MAGPTLAERQGIALKEPQLEESQRRAAVLEINDAVAAHHGIGLEQRGGMITGRDGFMLDGTRGPDLTKVTFPGITSDGNRFIIRTFFSGKGFDDPSFEVVYPGNFKNLGISTQNALEEARKLLIPPPQQIVSPALTL